MVITSDRDKNSPGMEEETEGSRSGLCIDWLKRPQQQQQSTVLYPRVLLKRMGKWDCNWRETRVVGVAVGVATGYAETNSPAPRL